MGKLNGIIETFKGRKGKLELVHVIGTDEPQQEQSARDTSEAQVIPTPVDTPAPEAPAAPPAPIVDTPSPARRKRAAQPTPTPAAAQPVPEKTDAPKPFRSRRG